MATCSGPAVRGKCKRAAVANGLCLAHLRQSKKGDGKLSPIRERKDARREGVCDERDCGEPEYAKGKCYPHWRQLRRSGETKPVRRRGERLEHVTTRVPAPVKDALGPRVSERARDVLTAWHDRQRKKEG